MPASFNTNDAVCLDYVPRDMPLSIEGLNVGQFGPEDMYNPVIRTYPYPFGRDTSVSQGLNYSRLSRFIEHVDIATVWKGLSFTDAEELFDIHKTFQISLEHLLVDALHQLHKDFQQKSLSYQFNHSDDLENISIIRQINFSQSQLIQNIHRMLRTVGEQLEESGMQGSMRLLSLYLTTCDYVMKIEDTSLHDAAIEIGAHYEKPAFRTIPPGLVFEAVWIPKLLSFEQVREIYREGQEIIIVPHYNAGTTFTADECRQNIYYTIGSAQEWLKWDNNILGFRGTVPMYSELRGSVDKRFGKAYERRHDGPYTIVNTIQIEVKALITDHLGGCVCLERTIRTRLTLQVFPWYAHASACTSSNIYFKGVFEQCSDHDPSSTSSESCCSWPIREQRRERREVWDGNYEDHETSDSPFGISPKPFSLYQEPTVTKLDIDSRKRRAVSGLEPSSPTKRCRESDDESQLLTLPMILGYDTARSYIDDNNENCMSNLSLQDDPKPGFIRKVSEHSELFCYNKFSPLRDLVSSSSSGENIEETKQASQKAVNNSPLSSFESSSESSSEPSSESSYRLANLCAGRLREDSAYSINENHLHSEDKLHQCSCVKALERPKSSFGYEREAGSAGANTMALAEQCWVEPCRVSLSGPSMHTTPCDSELQHYHAESDDNDSCSDSFPPDFIVENHNLDPRIRKEQAILWRLLSDRKSGTITDNSILSVEERKDIYEAMKKSTEEEENRKHAKLGLADDLGDIFIVEGSSSDDAEDLQSSHGKSDISSDKGSELGSVDRQLVCSLNFGF